MYRRVRFTLIELVAAMMIMMVVALIIGSAGSAFYNGYRRSVRTTERLQERMAIDRIWDSALVNMIHFKWKDEEGSSRYVFSGKSDELWITFLRRVYGDDPGGIMFIRFRVDNENLVAEYADTPYLPWEEESPKATLHTEILAKNVAYITFQYADWNDDNELEWLEEWEEEEHNDLPLAIRMTVEWKDGTREYWLRRTAGVSYNSTFGDRSAMTGYTSSGGVTTRNSLR